jgi:hypothetical protein
MHGPIALYKLAEIPDSFNTCGSIIRHQFENKHFTKKEFIEWMKAGSGTYTRHCLWNWGAMQRFFDYMVGGAFLITNQVAPESSMVQTDSDQSPTVPTVEQFVEAASVGDFYNVRALLENQMETAEMINATDAAGRTLLSFAAELGASEVVTAFLGSKKVTAEMINATDKLGRTALFYAAVRGQSEVVTALLQSGKVAAEMINAADFFGYTALGFATQKGHVEVKAAIEAALR